MLPLPLTNASDAYVSEKYPSRNFNAEGRIYLADGSAADTRYGYIYFGVPSGMAGTTLQSAKLRFHSGGPGWGGSVTLTVQRLGGKFSANRVNWNNKPAVAGTVASLTKSNAPAGTLWEFDVMAFLQTVANGAPWYGFRISATGATPKWLYANQGPDEMQPELELVWSEAPDTPTVLKPDNGRAVSVTKPTLQWDFSDPSGDQTMASAGLRLFGSQANADANTAPLLDITIPTTVPEFDLDDALAAAYGGLAADATLWWRALNTDGSGLSSGWSDPAFFTRKTKGTLTLTNPSAATPVVNESTPPFIWTFTGRTQVKYELILTTPETPARYIWTSGVVTSTETSVTPPANKITVVGKTYRAILRIYDDQLRQTVPDDPAYVEVVRDFVFDLDAATASPATLSGQVDVFKPKITLTWTRSTAPDSFVLLRDGNVVSEMLPVDVLVGGTTDTYRTSDSDARPRIDHTWEVAAKVNGKLSRTNPTVVDSVKAITTTLSETDNDKMVYLMNPEVSAAKTEASGLHYPVSGPPVLVFQTGRGYEGTVTGVLTYDTIPGINADDQLVFMNFFRDHPGRELKLTWVDKVMRVVVFDVTDEPIAYPDGTVEYLVTFSFAQVNV